MSCYEVLRRARLVGIVAALPALAGRAERRSMAAARAHRWVPELREVKILHFIGFPALEIPHFVGNMVLEILHFVDAMQNRMSEAMVWE